MPDSTSGGPYRHTPSLDRSTRATVAAARDAGDATAVGWLLAAGAEIPASLGLDVAAAARAGFDASPSAVLGAPSSSGKVNFAVGVGDLTSLDEARLRDAAGALAKAASAHTRLAVHLGDTGSLAPEDAAQAVVEGALLGRYRYDALRSSSPAKRLESLTIVTDADVSAAVERGHIMARATMLSRDLANTPHSHLSARKLADIAVALGSELGFGVEVFDENQLREMGIGGLLGVGAGSAEPPRMIKLSYSPPGATGHIAMVGKGIMYDSGGISLKPADIVHAAMKNDMSGSGAILAAVAALAELGSTTAVTGYLMCTDSMPSGSAMAMGDVITIRGGTTIEVVNTDAEGRLVMADGLVLAREQAPDAIVDIATLTGASMRALGTEVASVFSNDQALADQVKAAAEATDEPVWQMPLYRGYRKQLDSPIADMKNLGYGEGGAITAALFLEEFVGGIPWAHIDIAGTAVSTDGRPWHAPGCTGFGARLLVELAHNFRSAHS